ncbi:rust resistance kinase Lr10-like [Carex rostrata]
MKFINLLIFLFLFYNFECSSSSSFGELHNITYPYHLPGACKWKAYELQCDGNDTVLYIGATKYLVKDMSVENKTLRIVDPDLAAGGCRLPKQTLSLNKYPNLDNWYSIKEFALYDNWYYYRSVHFFNCTEEVEDNKMYKLIDCMDGPRSRVYAAYSHDAGSTPKSCRYVGGTVSNYEVYKHWNDSNGVDMMKMLRGGFVVSWNRTEFAIIAPELGVNNNKMCSGLEFCWSITKSGLMMRDPIRYKLLELVFLQTIFLDCIYEPSELGTYTTSHVLFGFMLILVVILEILLVLLALRLTLLPLATLLFLLHKYKRVSLSMNSIEKFLRKHEMLSVRRYDFIEISIMTNHFREKLGQGGFGSVYKGKLFNGCEVAVKILTNSLGDGDDFMSEVATIGRIHHANIVRLIGFCSEGSNRALVYPYMSKSSLDKYIFSSGNSSFSIEKKREIALGIARGIDYLHRGCQMQILHFDIKPHNILLDHDLTPKISDFGLAKLYSREFNLVTLNTARGTVGYIAPELISRAFGVISYKADVYSFGMLLMEMASGRRNVDNHAESSNQVYYPSWIYDQLNQANETHNYNLNNSVAQFGETEGILYKVALWCIQMRASNRPSMSRVIEMLQCGEDSLEMPPRPFMTCSPENVSMRCSQVDSCSIKMSEISEEISLL